MLRGLLARAAFIARMIPQGLLQPAGHVLRRRASICGRRAAGRRRPACPSPPLSIRRLDLGQVVLAGDARSAPAAAVGAVTAGAVVGEELGDLAGAASRPAARLGRRRGSGAGVAAGSGSTGRVVASRRRRRARRRARTARARARMSRPMRAPFVGVGWPASLPPPRDANLEREPGRGPTARGRLSRPGAWRTARRRSSPACPARSYRRSGLVSPSASTPRSTRSCPRGEERGEGVRQQGAAEAAAAPRPAHAEPLDPAEVAVVVGDEAAGRLVAVPGDPPEVRVEVGVPEQAGAPGVEGLLALAEVVLERLVHRSRTARARRPRAGRAGSRGPRAPARTARRPARSTVMR